MDRCYNQNAEVQRGQGVALVDSIRRVALGFEKTETLVVVDFGCGPGVNSVAPLQIVLDGAAAASVENVHALMVDSQMDLELWTQLNGKLEQAKTSDSGSQVSFTWTNVARSFYMPLDDSFKASVNLAWCSVAAHWLSALPTECPNFIVGNQLKSGDTARNTWMLQAKQDWAHWLQLRASELQSGGCLVIAMPGRDSSGDFVAKGAWDVFADIKEKLVQDGDLSVAAAARVATREYWRSEEEVFEPLNAPESELETESYWIEHRPCPFVENKKLGRMDTEQCADKLITAFQGFLSTEFNAALGDASSKFWAAAKQKALHSAESMDLHVVMHHLVLRKKPSRKRPAAELDA